MTSISTGPINRAMILAAGLGTRFKPWTDHHPKALALVNDKPLLQWNIEYLQQFGIRDIVINVHHFAGQIADALKTNDGWGSRYTISDETGEVLETGGGLKKARFFLEGAPFVLMNVDVLTDLDLAAMIADHFQHRPMATLAVTDRPTSRYFLFDHQNELCGWRNILTGEERITRPAEGRPDGRPLIQWAFSGIHVIDPAIFDHIGRTGKFSVIDMYLDLASLHIIRGYDHTLSRFIDVGKPASASAAAILFS
jgi:MurNAc alpha-1-phosphate uridylyltransferase